MPPARRSALSFREVVWVPRLRLHRAVQWLMLPARARPQFLGAAAPSAAPRPVPPVPPALSVPFSPSAPRLARPACPACSVRPACSSRLSRSSRLPRPPRLLAPFVLRRPSPPASGVGEASRSVVFGVGKRLMPTSRLFRCSRIRNNREVGGFWPISTKLAVISDRDSAK